MSGSVKAFIQRYLPDAQAVSAQTGLAPDFVLGVAGLESGWGQHFTGNNLFGIGGNNPASYSSPDESFSAFGSLIANSPNYQAVRNAGGDPQAEALALGSTSYNPAGAVYGNAVSGTTQMVSNVTGGLSGNQTAGGMSIFQTPWGDPVIAPDTPAASSALTGSPNNTSAAIQQSGAGQGIFGISNWVEEIVIRVAMVIIGLALIMGGFYLIGRRVTVVPPARIPVRGL